MTLLQHIRPQGIRVVIREREHDWLLSWPAGGDESHATAAEAQRAVMTMTKLLAEAGTSSIVSIDWQPTTTIGLRVVRALQ